MNLTNLNPLNRKFTECIKVLFLHLLCKDVNLLEDVIIQKLTNDFPDFQTLLMLKEFFTKSLHLL